MGISKDKDDEAMASERTKDFLTQIKDSVESTIVIKKENSGLGLQIVGGSDTYLTGIVIKTIEPDGAVARDKRLKVGDQILEVSKPDIIPWRPCWWYRQKNLMSNLLLNTTNMAAMTSREHSLSLYVICAFISRNVDPRFAAMLEVNGSSLREIPHQRAVSTLRVAKSPLRLVIFREDPEKIFTTKETPKSLIKVRLHKSISENIGLSILARKDGNGVFVTYVTEGSVADLEGTIQQGDRIMEVNKQDLRNATQEHATHVLKRCYGNIKLTIGRVPSLIASIKESADKTQQFGYVNHALSSDDKDTSPRRHRSSSYGSHVEFSKRATSTPKDENRNQLAMPKERRRSATIPDQPENDDLKLDRHLEIKNNAVEPEALQLTIDERLMRQQMLESYGREDYV